MGRPIRVTIDSDDLKELFYERVNYADTWMRHYEDAEAFNQYYDDLIDGGVFDDWKDFDIAAVVDNDVVNYIDTYTAEEFEETFGVSPTSPEGRDRVIFTATNGIYFVDARG